MILVAAAGSGKTTALELALGGGVRPVAWIGCSTAVRDPGVLLLRLVAAISEVAPGATDVIAERLPLAPERVDPLEAARELAAELSRLLVEPLTLVVDDAEHLDGADDSLSLLAELIRAEAQPLRVAIASRRPLNLRVAKPRAAGRLTELGAAELAFDGEECAALLRVRTEVDPSADRVAAVMDATEGWPLGIALVAEQERGRLRAAGEHFASLASPPDLRAYLSEELLDPLEPTLREALIDTSVARVVTPAVARALDLPDDFGERIERAGILVRWMDDGVAVAYHPLLREFLLERLREERADEDLRRLHAAVAPAVADDGDPIGAVEHWLEARCWPEAVAALERTGPTLVRTSQELVRGWLSLLPDAERARPTMRALEGQLDWLAGHATKSEPALRDALAGFRAHPNPTADWLTRSMLLDALWGTGDVNGLQGVVEGWDQPAAAAAGGLAPAAAMFAAAILASFARFEDADRLATAARERGEAELIAPSYAVLRFFVDVPRGRLGEVCVRLERAARDLERSDPLQLHHHILAALALVLADRGLPDQALRTWMQIRESARGGAAPRLADAAQGWCALLHAQAGRLDRAERELAGYEPVEVGTRGFIASLAPAAIASLHGNAADTVALANEALEIVAGGSRLFRYGVGADLVAPLADVHRLDRAHEVLADTLALIDAHYAGPLGCYPRARLLALRAWLRHTEGDAAGADADLGAAWGEAGPALDAVLRRDWRRLEPLVWRALERGALDAEPTVERIARAFPEGLQLVPFLDHTVAAVTASALDPAVASGDPVALASLARLARDPDRGLAGAAALAAERLATSLPPLRLELLGGFAVRRGAWRVGPGDWGRPIDARLVRFLLTREGRPVPDEVIFEALWPQLAPSSARRSLQVAVSRVRQLLDPPGVARSVIESRERSYWLVVGERGVVDADEFSAAAELALAEHGERRRRLLGRARSLWGGEPLPDERYSEWATAYRERLIDRYTAVLTALVGVQERIGELAEAAEAARELVELDPLNEGAHRALMVISARAGRRGHALRQYLECRRALVETLGLEPAAETSRLQARILAGEAV